jgi:hypothetical protein
MLLQLLHSVVVYEVIAVAFGVLYEVTAVVPSSAWLCHVLLLCCHGYLHSEHCCAFVEEFAGTDRDVLPVRSLADER